MTKAENEKLIKEKEQKLAELEDLLEEIAGEIETLWQEDLEDE